MGPFTLLCLHPHSLEPWRGETGPSCQHTGGLRVHRSAGAAPACMGLVQSSGCWWTELQSSSSLPQRTHPTPGGCGDSAGSCLGSPGAGRSRSPPLGMQSLLRMCACSCVCVFIRVSLFKKQPSLWSSWILHVRVNPPVPCPPPLSPRPFLPSPLFPPLSSQPCCSLQRKGLWETPGLFPPIPQLLPAGAVCMPPPEPRGTPYPFPFPLSTKEKKEFQTTTRLCGLASYPKLCCQLAPCRGRVPMEPRTEGYPPVLPGSTLLLSVAVFSTTTCSGIFLPTRGFSHEVSFWPVFQESQPPSAHPSPCLAGWIPTSRANNCLPVCLGFTRTFFSCLRPQWLAVGWTLQAQPPANMLGGAGPSPGKLQVTAL